MPTVIAYGNDLLATGAEQELAVDDTNQNYVLVVDTALMANGDTLELRIYTSVLAGPTARVAYYAVYAHIQAQPIKYSVPVPANKYIKCTLKQTLAPSSYKTFDWALLSVT